MEIIESFPAGSGAVGRYQSGQFRTLSGYPLAGLDFAIVDVEYPNNDGMLGYNFLLHYSVFIDFGMDTLYLKPAVRGNIDKYET